MKTGILFPGHGSQKPQMLHELVRNPAVDETLSEVSDVLAFAVRTLDTPEALQSEVAHRRD
jgi:malonate decarboxylase epsilon subunit